MHGSIRLTTRERKMVLKVYRSSGDSRRTRKAHILLLLDRQWAYRMIMECLFCSSDLISDVKRQFLEGGLEGVLGQSSAEAVIPFWQVIVAGWVREKTPQDFGYYRSRWTAGLLAELLEEEQGIKVSAETIRRVLHRLGFVWRRPRPIVGPTDPDYDQKLRKIRRLLSTLPANEVAVFQDEVDVNLNPRIGSQWMLRGDQAEVSTPGNNVKRYLCGSLVWGTGTLLLSPPGKRRNADLFIEHLDDLRSRLRGYRKIHVICDNAAFHDCRKVEMYLARWGHRIEIHFLPKYAPETNPIERVWWHMHETITRNHRCQSIDELLMQVYQWFSENNNYYDEVRNNYALAA